MSDLFPWMPRVEGPKVTETAYERPDGLPVFYRYSDPHVFENGEFHPIQVDVWVGQRRTRCGWWCLPAFIAGLRPDNYYIKRHGKWISDLEPYTGSVPPRRWAYQDKRAAMHAYRWRKVRQIQRLEATLDMARWSKAAIEEALGITDG